MCDKHSNYLGVLEEKDKARTVKIISDRVEERNKAIMEDLLQLFKVTKRARMYTRSLARFENSDYTRRKKRRRTNAKETTEEEESESDDLLDRITIIGSNHKKRAQKVLD